MLEADGQTSRPKSGRTKLLVLILILAAILVAGWVVNIAGSIYSFGQVDETTAAEAAIVLGAGTRSSGPSAVFRERIDHAIDLYRRGVVDVIILTGGLGSGRQVADSEIALQYVLENGLPTEDIYTELTSETTFQNLAEAQLLMQEHGWQTALVVSDPLHMYRAMSMAADLGLDVKSSPTPTSRIASPWATSWFLIRETILVIQYSLFGPN